MTRSGTGDGRGTVCSLLLAAGLAAVTLALFSPVRTFQFLGFDDLTYVADNPMVGAGLTGRGFQWAFVSMRASNWHPLTWLSLMADVQMFGPEPGPAHLINAAIHAANAALLCWGLGAMTGAVWPGALAAALFAVHPLHVESVAWVAERKDVLSTFFWLLAVGAYLRHVRRPGRWRYLASLLLFALGLLSKPMVVTLPLVLLILDFWPLNRWGRAAPAGWTAVRLTAEKIPFLVLSAASASVTWAAQSRGGSMNVMHHPVAVRLANVPVSCVTYLAKAVWPSSLAALYPYRGGDLPAWQVAGAVALLAGITVLAASVSARAPYVPAGWAFFLVTLLPVLGIVQVGIQAVADRYTYVPLTGPFLAAAWGMRDLARRWRLRPAMLAPAAGAVLCLLAFATWRQLPYWRDTVTLFERALSVTSGNWLAHLNLGAAYEKRGQLDEAVGQYHRALAIAPGVGDIHYNLGVALARQGKLTEAADRFREALRLNPDDWAAGVNLERLTRNDRRPGRGGP